MTDHSQISDNTGRVLALRPSGRTTVLALTYNSDEVEALRRLASSIVIKYDKHPSMSLLARLGLSLVEAAYDRDPEGVKAQLSRMVTPVPKPAKRENLKRGRVTQ